MEPGMLVANVNATPAKWKIIKRRATSCLLICDETTHCCTNFETCYLASLKVQARSRV